MLIWTTLFSRKQAVLTVIGVGIIMAILIVLTGRMDSDDVSSPPTLLDNAQRVEYLQSLGWEVTPEPLETLQFLFPEKLEEPYLSYHQLQLSHGFDLSACCGKQVARYTYAVTNYPGREESVQINLYVCEDLPVAGDTCCLGANGFQRSLQFPQSQA